jgi:AAA+ superfamily predicted ATPase
MCKTDVIAQVVNALLTQLDKLKHRKNVLIMSTSNLVKAIGVYLFKSFFNR